MQTALAVPMVWSDELRGVLSIGWAERHRINDEDLHTIEAIAGLATVACRNAEAYEHVQHVARTDALTGVLNHGAMQIRIREEIARARRDGARWAPSSSTSTTSRASTTPAATPPATSCCAGSPARCSTSCAPTTRSPATAATSSSCCSPAPTRP